MALASRSLQPHSLLCVNGPPFIANVPEGIMVAKSNWTRCAPNCARQAKKTQEPKPAVEDGKPSKNFDEKHAQPLAYLFERDRQDASRDKGDGSNRLFAACCRCVEHDLPDDAALAVLAKYAKHKPFHRLGIEVVIKRLRSAEKKVERGAAKKRRSGPSMLSVGQLLKDHPRAASACG